MDTLHFVLFQIFEAAKAEKPKAAKKPVNKDEKKPQVNVEDMTEEEKKKAQEEADLENATKLFGDL
jgi:hypothetical protein